MDTEDIKYAIALTLLEGVGPVNAKKLLAYCGDFQRIFQSTKIQLHRIPGIGSILANKIFTQLSDKSILERAEREIAFVEKNELRVFLYTESDYPLNLKQCEDCPMVLYGKGNIDFKETKIISVVGTRKITERGKEVCVQLVKGLEAYAPLVISGMAYGVDIHTHKACVEHDLPTVGVLAHGLDRLYPQTHQKTADKMMKQGGLLTEFMSGTNPDRENFPKRNRIIAGLADATVVVESARRGGSLITAEIANSYSRDVFAVPGRITDSYSEGCNFLIKTNKAHLLHGAEDIVYLMNWELTMEDKPNTIQRELFVELPPDEKLVCELLSSEEHKSIEQLIHLSDLSSSTLAVILLQLEFKGLVKSLPGSSYRLI